MYPHTGHGAALSASGFTTIHIASGSIGGFTLDSGTLGSGSIASGSIVSSHLGSFYGTPPLQCCCCNKTLKTFPPGELREEFVSVSVESPLGFHSVGRRHFCKDCFGWDLTLDSIQTKEQWIRECVPLAADTPATIVADWLDDHGRDVEAAYMRKVAERQKGG